jgi:SAM-dependent methyltransferase
VLSRALDYAHRRLPNVALVQMDARAIPFDAEFDIIGAFDVLEHVDDDAAVLRQMYAAVVAGGGVVITVPQHPSLWSAVDDFSHHRRRYTRSELTAKLEAVGFRIVRVTSFVSVLLPLLLVSRRSRQPLDPERELRVANPINRVLSALLTCERFVISAGVSLPAGGSLLAVAMRPQ